MADLKPLLDQLIELHKPNKWDIGIVTCWTCRDPEGPGEDAAWPCPTAEVMMPYVTWPT